MGTESIEASFLSIFALISFFIFLLASKYSNKIRGGALLDKDFLKPQAFHDVPITRSGGVAAIISLSIFFDSECHLTIPILAKYLHGNFSPGSFFLPGAISEWPRILSLLILYFLIKNLLKIKIDLICFCENRL